MKKNVRCLPLLILGLIFILPGIFAVFFYTYPELLGSTTTNRGKLITPKLLAVKSEQDKWRLILWQNSNCDAACMDLLENLAKVRLALGRRLYNTELILLSREKISASIVNTLKEHDILVDDSLNTSDIYNLSPENKIYFQDSNGYLILEYNKDLNLKDLLHDMKHLLSQDG